MKLANLRRLTLLLFLILLFAAAGCAKEQNTVAETTEDEEDDVFINEDGNSFVSHFPEKYLPFDCEPTDPVELNTGMIGGGMVVSDGQYIYLNGPKKPMCRMNMDATGLVHLNDSVMNWIELDVEDGWIYGLEMVDDYRGAVKRMSVDGAAVEVLTDSNVKHFEVQDGKLYYLECLDEYASDFDLYECELLSSGTADPKLLYHNGVTNRFDISCGWLYYENRVMNPNEAGLWFPGASGYIYRGNGYYIFVSDGVRSLQCDRPNQQEETIFSTDENISLMGIVDDTIILKEGRYDIQGYSLSGEPTEFSNSDAESFHPLGAAGEWVALAVRDEILMMNVHTEETFLLQF